MSNQTVFSKHFKYIYTLYIYVKLTFSKNSINIINVEEYILHIDTLNS